MKRKIRRGLLIAASLMIVSIAVLIIWVSPLLHISNGTVKLPGLNAPVEVIRDQNGVPHIKAAQLLDAYTALGFVHARDRFWQMEATRRLGTGRLAEVVGKPALHSDKMMRTLGLAQLAKRQFSVLSTPVRQSLIAYAAGVNAWLKTHHGALSPEFAVFGYSPEPWRPVDSLIWGKLMGLRLSRNWRFELLRYRLMGHLSIDKIRDLWPAMPPGDPVSITLGKINTDEVLDQSFAMLDRLIGPFSEASNAWVVSGNRTNTGKPILANDPHLGYSIPILWYLARIETPGHTLIGATVPGLPFHILGQNKNIAWGLTTTSGDTADLFIEKTDPKDSSRYITHSGSKQFQIRHETISVHDAKPVTLTIRETENGPIVSDILSGPHQSSSTLLSLKATFLAGNDHTPEAIYNLNQAKDWPTFLKALRRFHAPQQNVMFADHHGNIGLVAAGRMPVRKQGRGWQPQDSMIGQQDWKNFIPFNELPMIYNPPSGLIVNANNRVVSRNYPYFISEDFAPGYRAKRITDELTREKTQTLKSSAKLQLDEVSIMAQEILPILLGKISAPPKSKFSRDALKTLKAWDGKMERDSPAPLIFNAWLRELIRIVAKDDLGKNFRPFWYVRAHFIRSVLKQKNTWCDNITTLERIETCEESVMTALEESLIKLKYRFGEKITNWRWGAAHRVEFRHLIFGKIPLISMVSNRTVETGGGQFTPHKGGYRYRDENNTFENRHGPGYRAVYDLADLTQSRFVIATGQSGHLLSSFYDNFINLWEVGGAVSLKLPRDVLVKSHHGILRFMPEGKPLRGTK